MARAKKIIDEAVDLIEGKPPKQPISIIKKLEDKLVGLEIAGDFLIQNCFNQKTMEEMLRAHMGGKAEREPKNPRMCIENAIIRNTEGHVVMPSTSIKKGMLSAAAAMGKGGPKGTHLRQQIAIDGSSVRLKYEKMVPRVDMVRVGKGVPDIRFRPMFCNWTARILIIFSSALIVEMVVDLLNRAGRVGIGEWRPEKNGTFGTYKVARNISDPKEIAEVREENKYQVKPLIIPDWAMDMSFDPRKMSKIMSGEEEENITNQEELAVGDEAYTYDTNRVATPGRSSKGH